MLAALGGRSAPGELGKLLGLDHNAQARALGALERVGLVDRSKAAVALTSAGWAEFAPLPTVGAGAVLDEALALWPYSQQACIELAVSAIVARHHLGSSRPGLHLGFMLIGATGTGKTAVAEFVCSLFGWPAQRHRRWLPQETTGAVRGRRVPGEGGRFGFVPADLLELPFVCFDEFDKADEPLRRAVLPYFQGEIPVTLEGQAFLFRPTPMLAANPPERSGRYAQLRQEYRRRCVVLDTGDTAPPELEANLLAYYGDRQRRPLLSLDRLAPPADTLPDPAREVLGTVRRVLTKAGEEEFPGLRALELAALGRAALLGSDVDLRLAALATGLSYLACAETVPGQVVEGWHLDLQAVHAALADTDVSSLDKALGRRQRELDVRRQQARGRARTAQAEDLEVVRRRAELVAELEAASRVLQGRSVPANHRVRASGIRAQVQRLRSQAAQSRTPARLEDLAAAAAAPLAAGRQLRAQLEQERHQRARDDEIAKQQAAADRREAKEVAKLRAEQKRRFRRARKDADAEQRRAEQQRRAGARELQRLYERKTTKPTEDVLAVLVSRGMVRQWVQETWERDSWLACAAEVLELSHHQHPEPALRADAILESAPAQPTDGKRYRPIRHVRYVAADRQVYEASQLRTWQAPAVRAVLRAAATAAGVVLSEPAGAATARARGAQRRP